MWHILLNLFFKGFLYILSPAASLIKNFFSISDFFESPNRRLTILHPTLCITNVFFPIYDTEKVKKLKISNVSSLLSYLEKTKRSGNAPPSRDRVNMQTNYLRLLVCMCKYCSSTGCPTKHDSMQDDLNVVLIFDIICCVYLST